MRTTSVRRFQQKQARKAMVRFSSNTNRDFILKYETASSPVALRDV